MATQHKISADMPDVKPVSKPDWRFIAESGGKILTASPDFCALFDADEVLLYGQSIAGFLSLTPWTDAKPYVHLGRFNAFARNGDAPPVLPEGLFPLYLNGRADPILFQIDHIKGQDGRGYIVANGPADLLADSQPHASDAVIPIRKHSMHIQGQWPWMHRGYEITTADMDWAQFAKLVDDVALVLRGNGEVVRCNEIAYAVFWNNGTPQNLHDSVYDDDRVQFRTMMGAIADTPMGDTMVMDCRHRRINKDVVWYRWRFRRGSDDTIYALGHDITAIKVQERNLRRREQQLSVAEAIARMGRWRWVVGTNLFDWSNEIYRIFGVEPARFVPSIENVHALIQRRDLGMIYQAFQRAIIQRNDYEIDFRIQHPSGQLRYIRCEGRCEMDSEGDVIALYGIMQDVTAQIEHERDLRKAKDAAETAYASKSRFLANMSHELRTPLNAIIGFSDLMQKQMFGPLGHNKYGDYVTAIKESGQHLLDLISDILDMSKIEAGKYELHYEKVEITKLMGLTAHMMEGRAQDAGVKLYCRPTCDEDFTIIADRRAVMQILLNLTSNAVKFTESGGEVEISCRRLESQIAISVRDTGIGIPANKLADVLKPFEQVSSAFSRKHEGSGLGLSITKDLVELHGGTISIDSKVDVGTVVTIRLPITPKHLS